MKLQLTKQAELELEIVNAKFTKDNGLDYHDLTKREKQIADAEMYVCGDYEENTFDNLEEWCREVQLEEYTEEYTAKNPHKVLRKINRMIKVGIVEVVD